MDHPVRSPTDQDENVRASPATTMIINFVKEAWGENASLERLRRRLPHILARVMLLQRRLYRRYNQYTHIEEASSLPRRMIHVKKWQWWWLVAATLLHGFYYIAKLRKWDIPCCVIKVWIRQTHFFVDPIQHSLQNSPLVLRARSTDFVLLVNHGWMGQWAQLVYRVTFSVQIVWAFRTNIYLEDRHSLAPFPHKFTYL